MSIRHTSAIAFHVIQYSFVKVNSYVVFPVNKCHVALNHVVHAEHPVKIDCTSPLVHHKSAAGIYSISHVSAHVLIINGLVSDLLICHKISVVDTFHV